MRVTLALAVLLVGVRAFAGTVDAERPHTASITGFTGAYLDAVMLSQEADPRYGSRLLDALDTHLQAVGVMTGPREVADYLEQSAGGSEGVKALQEALGREPLDTTKAAALLLADALARPEQFREVLDGLESLKHGLGRHAAELLRGARGTGDKRLFAALHEAGKPGRKITAPHMAEGWFSILFDEKPTDAPAVARRRALDRALPARP